MVGVFSKLYAWILPIRFRLIESKLFGNASVIIYSGRKWRRVRRCLWIDDPLLPGQMTLNTPINFKNDESYRIDIFDVK